ncbi:MAG: hypothetical protein JXB00_04440 [Bacteroidales bacterium]|nr:hypothetical protein [Bacteroidales bacterium]
MLYKIKFPVSDYSCIYKAFYDYSVKARKTEKAPYVYGAFAKKDNLFIIY